jgi:signal transduction histidine kinase/CheY-like chemotaxis protein/HPt (histidine-containing phosphotransfer) domain-containing protein
MIDTHKNKKPNDWQKNWGSSIAVKVTAPLFWILISVGLIIATIIQNRFAAELPHSISSDADRIAYAVSSYLIELEGGQPLDLQQVIESAMTGTHFLGGDITVGLRNIHAGESFSDKNGVEQVTRLIPFTNKITGGDSLITELVLYHKPHLRIIKDQRKHMLLQFGLVFFIFGLLLAGLIHVIVTKPIFRLLSATKAVSEGDMTSRLENDRKDEFGELTEFFNRMLDKLQNKQDELSLAVKVAESASNAKSAFLANMSHEIRTPLTAILGFSEMLKEDGISKNDIHQYVESVIRAGNHLQQIINDILDMSKIEAGQLVIENGDVDLFEVIRDCDYLMRPYAEEKQLKFRIKHKFPLPGFIVTDAKRLKQVLLNLCSNAIKFTTDGNVDISVEYNEEKQRVQFEVTDTGVGMTQKELERLFKPFSQVDTSTTRQYGGSGLGLCICRELVTSLGGEIACQSRKGIGSRFFFTIDPGPIREDQWLYRNQETDAESHHSQVTIKPGSLTGKVLLAEDTLDNQKLISMYIKRAGATPVVVENGKQALDRALSEEFDLILMDMQMPVMSGLDATAKLRATGYKHPIVALTANALKEDRERSQRAGVDDYLTKPMDLNRFNEVLTRYLKPAHVLTGEFTSPKQDRTKTDFTDDPEFQALVRRFENELPEKIHHIKVAADQHDWVQLKSHVHKLKGMGASFGHPDLSDISAQIQAAIVKETFDKIPALIGKLFTTYHKDIQQNKRSSSF